MYLMYALMSFSELCWFIKYKPEQNRKSKKNHLA